MKAHAIKTLLALAAAVLVAACGFKLQGAAELPPQMARTQIETADPYSDFVRRLTILLEQNGARVVDEPPSGAVLEIPVNVFRKEILTIGDTARVKEYRIFHRVEFRLVDTEGAEIVPRQSLERSRVYNFNEQDILASTREEEFLRQELADTMSRLVLRQLGTSGP